jgi:endonuclease YncB( thermonuclease family)
MGRAVEQLRSGRVVAHTGLRSAGAVEPVGKDVHDGDTLAVVAAGDLGVRLLGVDAPEVAAPLPGTTAPLVALDDPRWEQALAAAFVPGALPLGPGGDPALVAHLKAQAVVGEAVNHARLAAAARIALVDMVNKDMAALGADATGFRLFVVFAGGVMDRYGRPLGYVRPDQPNVPTAQRFGSYNGRLLASGWASPYFIWPNTDPWRVASAIVDAVPAPGTAAQAAAADPVLAAVRASVKAARRQQIGLYRATRPLRLLAFELRMLSRHRPPDRWLVDLGSDSDTLVAPQRYPSVPLPEDRLFIPAEYVPLWVEKGWRLP